MSVGTGRQRALLALLILRANEPFAIDRLVEELWGQSPPATAPKMLHNQVSCPRESVGVPVNLGPQINTEHNEFCPSPQGRGRFMFVSNRPGGCGLGDIYVTRLTLRRGWRPPENLGCTINSAAEEAGPVRAGGALYFSSTRTGNSDIYASPAFGPWIGLPNPVAELNSAWDDSRPFVRPDGKEIVFDSNRPGGLGSTDVWAARRRHPWRAWSQPMNLGPAVNSPVAETRPSLSSDGTVLYFGSTRGESQDVFSSTRGG